MVFFMGTFSAPAQGASPSSFSKHDGRQRQFLVIGKADRVTEPLRNAIAPSGATTVREMTDVGIAVVKSQDPQFSSKVTRNKSVLGVVEDSDVSWLSQQARQDVVDQELPDVCPDVDLPRSEHTPWNIRQISADVIPPAPKAHRRVKVAVLDSGVNTNHVDLAANIDKSLSRSFVPSELTIDDANSHGSHVAGIIAAARNGKGVQGVAPDSSIVALKVLDANGNGTWSSILDALRYAAEIDVDVVNMSFGQSFDGVSEETKLLKTALDRSIRTVHATGAVVVASAGNNGIELGSNTLVLPAQSKHVMTVSATGPIEGAQFDRLASYSNYGRKVIDVAAPGGDFVSERSFPCDMVLSASARTDAGANQWEWRAGTSMAAPHVAGVAALVKGRFNKMHPALAQRWIERTSDDIFARGKDAESGWGRVDALRATSGLGPQT